MNMRQYEEIYVISCRKVLTNAPETSTDIASSVQMIATQLIVKAAVWPK